MVFGIIGAMQEEVDLFIADLVDTKEYHFANLVCFKGKLHSKEVVVVKSGAGKVNAAICTQLLIDKFEVSKVIFTGVAGALNKNLKIFDVVVSRETIQHDLDAVSLGYEKGQIPFTNLKSISASEELVDLALVCAKELNVNAISGKILTGDQFISDSELIKCFGGDCVDMESAAVAYTCFVNQIPHVIVRSISDNADGSAHKNFSEFLLVAAENSKKLVEKMIDKM